jgi:hypothetical protein
VTGDVTEPDEEAPPDPVRAFRAALTHDTRARLGMCTTELISCITGALRNGYTPETLATYVSHGIRLWTPYNAPNLINHRLHKAAGHHDPAESDEG